MFWGVQGRQTLAQWKRRHVAVLQRVEKPSLCLAGSTGGTRTLVGLQTWWWRIPCVPVGCWAWPRVHLRGVPPHGARANQVRVSSALYYLANASF